ncbi:hypothetical protein [Pedobacter nutrimenti]|jgi:hypothetical protein|uniref:Uncharacterized protein n=1 Tax=Pedobacter nutrimenti TaxID=1241337 RepID=A0A318UI13_9SPHI|nr:hypothetical protein [Pedobacter nutrimenti]PYF74698.1 hypothetical protein B0O44_103144 [Pedobacter nutrimenti]
MKKMLALLFAISTVSVCAQTKKIDKIIKKDHSVIEATVSKISDKSIEYVFSGETLVNSLDVSQIVRIEFANGRKQNFNSAPAEAPSPKPIAESVSKSASPEVQILKPNTIAVLPAPFVNSENLSSSEEMAKFAQSDIYNKLVAKLTNIFPLVVQDVRTTNSLLRKAGIDYKNIDETPIEDLQRILGVDNILAAKVSYSLKTMQTSTGFGSTNAKVEDHKIKGTDFSSANSTTSSLYDYNVYFDFYKNTSKIYTETRSPVFKTKDAWMDSISYLLKRCPIYKK